MNFEESPWHTFYIGLSYLENDYNITFEDKSGWVIAQNIQPNIKIYSREYTNILKIEFFSILLKDPLFILKTYFIKFLVSIWYLLKVYGIPLLVTLFIYFRFVTKKNTNVTSLFYLTFFGVLLGCIQGVIAWPTYVYIFNALGSIAYLNIFLLLEIASRSKERPRQIVKN